MKLTMKIPGYMKDHLFYLRILTICTVSSTALLTHSVVNGTSEGSTFTSYENLEVEVGELKVRATGKNTTEVLLNLLKTAKSSEIWSSSETF